MKMKLHLHRENSVWMKFIEIVKRKENLREVRRYNFESMKKGENLANSSECLLRVGIDRMKQ